MRAGDIEFSAPGPRRASLFKSNEDSSRVRVPLSDAESVVMDLLMRHRNNIVPKEELNKAFYGDKEPTSNVVEVLISRIRSKIQNAESEVEIKSIRSEGYMLHTGNITIK